MAAIRPAYYILAGGNRLNPVPGTFTQEELLEGWTTYVSQFESAEFVPDDVNKGDIFTINFMDLEEGTEWRQFTGYVDDLPVISFPNKQEIHGVGPLSRLRRCPNSDHNWTGLTDKEAVEDILSYCGVPFTSSDIHGMGYILGAIEPIKWHKDVEGWEILAELDRVFGYTTIENGAGRIIRFAYDKVPSSSDISYTFSRMDPSTKFYYGELVAGNTFDTIKNFFRVQGLSYECGGGGDASGDEKCQCNIWARGYADNALLGAGRRNKGEDINSDFIQDVNLAKRIVERSLRWYNRLGINLRVETKNNRIIMPGVVVGVLDTAPGMRLPTVTPFLVTRVVRRGGLMDVYCLGGAAGVVDNVTSGVDRKCNKTSSSPTPPTAPTPAPTPITPPYPPLVTPMHPPGDMCKGDRIHFDGCPTENATFVNGLVFGGGGLSWEISGDLTLNGSNNALTIGVHSSQGDYYLTIGDADFYGSGTPKVYEIYTPTQNSSKNGSFDLSKPIHWQLQWDGSANKMLTLCVDQDGLCYFDYVFHTANDVVNYTTYSSVVGSPTRSNQKVWNDCTQGVSPDETCQDLVDVVRVGGWVVTASDGTSTVDLVPNALAWNNRSGAESNYVRLEHASVKIAPEVDFNLAVNFLLHYDSLLEVNFILNNTTSPLVIMLNHSGSPDLGSVLTLIAMNGSTVIQDFTSISHVVFNQEITLAIGVEAATGAVVASVAQDGSEIANVGLTDPLIVSDWTVPATVRLIGNSAGSSGTPPVITVTLCRLCASTLLSGPVIPEWDISGMPSGWTDPWTTAWIFTSGATTGEARLTTDADDEVGDIGQSVPSSPSGLPARTRMWGKASASVSGIGLLGTLIGMYSDQFSYAEEGGNNYAEIWMETLGTGCNLSSGYDYASWQTRIGGVTASGFPSSWDGLCVGDSPDGISFILDWNAAAGTFTVTLNGNEVSIPWSPVIGDYFVRIHPGCFDPSTAASWEFTELQIQFGD